MAPRPGVSLIYSVGVRIGLLKRKLSVVYWMIFLKWRCEKVGKMLQSTSKEGVTLIVSGLDVFGRKVYKD